MRKIILKILIFSFLFLIYFSSSGGHLTSVDSVNGYLLTESLTLRQSAFLDDESPILTKYPGFKPGAVQYIESRGSEQLITSKYGPLHSIFAIPLFSISTYFGAEPDVIISLFYGSSVVAIIGVVLFSFATRLFHSEKIAFVIVLVNGLTSLLWVHSQYFLDQSLAALTVLVSVYFFYRTENKQSVKFSILAGVFIVLAVFARISDVIIVVGLIGYGIILYRKNIKNISGFLLPVLIGTIGYGFWNLLSDRTFFSLIYGGANFLDLANHESIEGLYALFISPGGGLFLYFPLAVLFPLGFYWFYKIDRKLTFLIAYIFFSTLIFLGTLSIYTPYSWWGGIWGPRLLLPALPLISLLLGAVLVKFGKSIFKQTGFIVLGVAGFIVNIFGVLVFFVHGFTYAWERDELWKIIPNDKLVITWDPIHSPIANHIKVLNSGYAQTDFPLDPTATIHTWGLSPCAFDLYIYCQFGLAALLIVIAIITLIAFLIVRSIKKKVNIS